MDNPRERDEFARIELHNKLERDREIVAMYEENFAKLREKIEDEMYKLGKLDQRLGSDSVNREREERQKRHLLAMHEYLIAEYRDDIVEYQQSMDEAAARGNEYERRMWEQRLAESKASLAREEARQVPV